VRLGPGVEATLHACVLLASLPPEKALPAAKIAEYHDLPGAQMAKYLQALSASGVLVSVRGRTGGGYKLARPADKVTVLEVVDAVEGGEPVFHCTGVRYRGPCATAVHKYRPACSVTHTMQEAERAWRDALAACTITDLVTQSSLGAPPEVVSSSEVWLRRSMR
jgi:Rrf2 family protein